MRASKPITAMAIAPPRCPKCGAQMSLVTISLRGEDNDERLYECARCQHEITEVVNFKQAS
jgi:DNA-directed RNA polymerase subunit M/transcription elongation factor TFIIS